MGGSEDHCLDLLMNFMGMREKGQTGPRYVLEGSILFPSL